MAVRARTVVLLSAAITVGLLLAAAGGGVLFAGSERGRALLRSQVERLLASRVNGTVHVGAIGGSLWSDLVLDSLAVRDAQDSLVLSVGRVRLTYDLADLLDRRLVVRSLAIEHPALHLRQDSSGAWAHRTLLRGGGGPTPPRTGRGLGDLIVLDSVRIRDGAFRWTQPWRPDAALRGAARDSAIAAELARADHDTRAVAGGGYVRARHWTGLGADLPHVRLAHPDTAGLRFVIARLDVDESDPPLPLRDVRGEVTVVNDSVRLALPAFRLPGSVGRAEGVITTRDGLGLAVRIEADSVALADINWVWPELPREGGGRLVLAIDKAPDETRIAYTIREMDVASMRSRLTGTMTFGVADALEDIRDVDVTLAPMDFVLIERLSGEPLPLPWAGALRGRVRGPGGPLAAFRLDEARLAFDDANVPGVTNRFVGQGTLDITQPALTTFRDFALDVERLELRTVQAVNPDFPPLRGWVAGTMRLDSVWTDVRFRDLALRYGDDTLPLSRVLGSGRVTQVGDDLRYDLALTADSLSLDAVAASYPGLPLRGMIAGDLTVRGRLGDLAVEGRGAGPAGALRAALQLDAEAPGYAVSGRVDLEAADPAGWWRGAARLGGEVTAGLDLALSGDSLADLDGGMKVAVGRSRLGDLRVYAGRGDLLFGDGRLLVDTLVVESSAATLRGRGALGLRADVMDSLQLAVELDSLGGLRPLAALLAGDDSVPSDSLAGRARGTALLRGNLDTLDLRARLTARELLVGGTEARGVTFDADVQDLRGGRRGDLSLRVDTMRSGGLVFERVDGAAALLGPDSADLRLDLREADGPSLRARAALGWDSSSTRLSLRTLDADLPEGGWRLAAPVRIVADADGVVVDSAELRTGARGSIRLAARVPVDGELRATLEVAALPLADLAALAQRQEVVDGRLTASVALTGTRDAPRLQLRAEARDARVDDARLEALAVTASYADRALAAVAELRARQQLVARATATLPVDLALRPVAQRRLDAPLQGTLEADSTDLAVLEALTPAIRGATGRLDARLRVSGAWERPRVDGRVRVLNGAFGLPDLGSVRWRDVQADLEFAGDTLHLRALEARSGVRGSARAFGWVALGDPDDLGFDLRLRADQFRAIAKANVATLEVSAQLRLAGRESGSDLTGALTIDAGDIIIPDVYKKNVISLDDPEFFNIVDTTVFANRQLLPSAPSALVENLRIGGVTVAAGQDLWLRSSEADVKLGGSLQVAAGRSQRAADRGARQLALDGTLRAERGTYRLNLGVLQRTFEVEGGTVRFFGDPDNNAALDIAALYTVRRFDQADAQQDVRVRAVLGGTLLAPALRLESPDSLRISGADLISYLVTGTPSFEVGGRASDYTGAAASALFSSLGSALGSRLTGGALDVFEVQTAAVGGTTAGGRNLGSSILSGTRLSGAGQLTDQLFLRIDAGLCSVGQLVGEGGGTFDPVSLADAVGLKIDWRVSERLAVSAGMEPSTSALLCASGANARGFAPTPRQWGLDVFRTWRF